MIMTSESAPERLAVIQEAMTWLKTPHRNGQRVKGAGVDCGTLLAEVFERAGVIPHVELESYPADWHLHQSEEKYLLHVEQFAHPIDGPPLPGDIALYRFGRCASHGAIVICWPQIIHAYVGLGVVLDDAEASTTLSNRFVGWWSMWGEP